MTRSGRKKLRPYRDCAYRIDAEMADAMQRKGHPGGEAGVSLIYMAFIFTLERY
jgi:hypothetical protein